MTSSARRPARRPGRRLHRRDAPYSCPLDTTTLADGGYDLRARRDRRRGQRDDLRDARQPRRRQHRRRPASTSRRRTSRVAPRRKPETATRHHVHVLRADAPRFDPRRLDRRRQRPSSSLHQRQPGRRLGLGRHEHDAARARQRSARARSTSPATSCLHRLERGDERQHRRRHARHADRHDGRRRTATRR